MVQARLLPPIQFYLQLKIKEFVNADEIARGLSPFQLEKVSIEAGKIYASLYELTCLMNNTINL